MTSATRLSACTGAAAVAASATHASPMAASIPRANRVYSCMKLPQSGRSLAPSAAIVRTRFWRIPTYALLRRSRDGRALPALHRRAALLPADQHEIAPIDEQAQRLAEDD